MRARPRGKPARSTAPADHADHAAGASSKPATAEATAPASSGGWKAALDWSAMLLVLVYGGYLAHYYGTLSLPAPQSAHAAGPGGFSEETAYAHVKALTQFGPHPVGSDALDLALEVGWTDAILPACWDGRPIACHDGLHPQKLTL